MHKVYFKISDNSDIESVYRYFQSNGSQVVSMDTLYSFHYNDIEYQYTGITFDAGQEYFGREYANDGSFIRFKVTDTNPLNGYWDLDGESIAPCLECLLENISKGNFSEFELEPVTQKEIARLENKETYWEQIDNTLLLNNPSLIRTNTGDIVEITTLADRGNHIFGVRVYSELESDMAEFVSKPIYDRMDVILFLGPKPNFLKQEIVGDTLDLLTDNNPGLYHSIYDYDDASINNFVEYEAGNFTFTDPETEEEITFKTYDQEQVYADRTASFTNRLTGWIAQYTATNSLTEITDEALELLNTRKEYVLQNSLQDYIQTRENCGAIILNLDNENDTYEENTIPDIIDKIRTNIESRELPILFNVNSDEGYNYVLAEQGPDPKIGLFDLRTYEDNENGKRQLYREWADFINSALGISFDLKKLEPQVWYDTNDLRTLHLNDGYEDYDRPKVPKQPPQGDEWRVYRVRNKADEGSAYDMIYKSETDQQPLEGSHDTAPIFQFGNDGFYPKGIGFNLGQYSNHVANLYTELNNPGVGEKLYIPGNPFINTSMDVFRSGSGLTNVELLEIYIVCTHSNRVYLDYEYGADSSYETTGTWMVMRNAPNDVRFLSHLPWKNGMISFDYGSKTGANRVYTTGIIKDLQRNLVAIRAVAGSFTEIWLNGNLIASNSGSQDCAAGEESYIQIGSSPGHYQSFVMHEMATFRKTLSVNQRQEVEGYLCSKWGLQDKLPASHPYKKQTLHPDVMKI